MTHYSIYPATTDTGQGEAMVQETATGGEGEDEEEDSGPMAAALREKQQNLRPTEVDNHRVLW